MRLTNAVDVEKFIKVVDECKSNVYLKSLEGDVFNLKSSMSQYVAIGRLVGEYGDSLELFADDKEDQNRLLNFLHDLEEEGKEKK